MKTDVAEQMLFLSQEQQKLLDTKMTELPGFSGPFKRHFLGNTMFDPKNVVTLKEFMELNPYPVSTNTYLICCNPTQEVYFLKRTLVKTSDHFKQLRRFLMRTGFTEEHWKLLALKGRSPLQKKY